MEYRLTKKQESYTDKETNETITYTQLYIVIDGVKTKIKPCYKSDKKYLVAMAEEAGK